MLRGRDCQWSAQWGNCRIFIEKQNYVLKIKKKSEMFWCNKLNLGSGYLIYCVDVFVSMWVCVGVYIFWKRECFRDKYNEKNQNAKFQRINYS